MDKHSVLREIKDLLVAKFGSEIERVILFGSQAEDAQRPDSDFDILVILKNPHDWRVRRQISEVCYDIDLKYDIRTDIKTISVGELREPRGRQPFIQRALKEGIYA
jgi:predicted nucleotidyltransferase